MLRRYTYKCHLIAVAAAVGATLVSRPSLAQETPLPTTRVAFEGQNARDYFLRAYDSLVDKGQIGTRLSPDQERILVERNANALEIVRQGRKLPFPSIT